MPRKRKGKGKRAARSIRRASASVRAQKSAMAAVPSAAGEASLIFPPHFQSEGFTSAGISQFNDKDIPSAVRELIQNSLDAAVEIRRRPAIVRFSVENLPQTDIPGLAGYKAAFSSASTVQKTDDGQAADIVADIAEALKIQTLPFLFVEDNGVGLDPKRMDALLGDGMNFKGGEGSIGSYGNGHLTVFCLSRLRYVLYGGVAHESGQMTVSGQAILASHAGKKGRCSAKGFYAVELSAKEGVSNTYPSPAQIPGLLKKRLEGIRSDFGSGTVVAVPGFNYFGDEEAKSIAESIKSVAALNFFPAVHEGDLEVRVREDNEETVLTKANLASYIQQQRETRGGNRGGFPTGVKAAASYQTLLAGKEDGEFSIPLPIENGGALRLLLRQGREQDVEMTRVTFCRNGMWVTDQVDMLRRTQFADKVPFDALLLANVGECKKFHDLMAKAEGRLHIDLKPRRLPRTQDRQDLRLVFDTVREFLRGKVQDSASEWFEPSNFYRIESGRTVGGGRRSAMMLGEAKPAPGTFAHSAAVRRKGKGKKSAQRRRTGDTMGVKVMSRRIGPNTLAIGVAFQEDCDNCELQMAIDNGTDPTCTGPLPKKRLRIVSAKLGDANLPLVGENAGIMLGPARTGERRIVNVEFVPGQLRESALQAVSCGFYRRAAVSRSGEEAQ